MSVDDNYVRKQFETWFARWSETAINLYFAERSGIEELQLNKTTANELRRLAAEGRFDLDMLSEDDKIMINYDTATPALKFEVDPTSSKKQSEVEQLQSHTLITDLLNKSPFLQGLVPQKKQLELWNAIVLNSGTDDNSKLTLSSEEMDQAIEAQAQAKQAQDDIRDIISTNYKDAPEDIKRQIEEKNGFQRSQMISPVEQAAQAKMAAMNKPEAPDTSKEMTPELILKAQKQTHDEEIDKAKLDLERQKLEMEALKNEETPKETD
jgi:hypothetical protein